MILDLSVDKDRKMHSRSDSTSTATPSRSRTSSLSTAVANITDGNAMDVLSLGHLHHQHHQLHLHHHLDMLGDGYSDTPLVFVLPGNRFPKLVVLSLVSIYHLSSICIRIYDSINFLFLVFHLYRLYISISERLFLQPICDRLDC